MRTNIFILFLNMDTCELYQSIVDSPNIIKDSVKLILRKNKIKELFLFCYWSDEIFTDMLYDFISNLKKLDGGHEKQIISLFQNMNLGIHKQFTIDLNDYRQLDEVAEEIVNEVKQI